MDRHSRPRHRAVFFASTTTKLAEGGWFPLVIAFVISFLMLTWRGTAAPP
jgi:K+ transporter